jgi:two-component system phosphate regulon sensor histidine kinase PhoR
MRREFVANASHELRTPVAAIHAVAETLAAAPNMTSGDRVRFERILMNHAGRLSRLVKDLLDLSRAEASRPRVEPVDLSKPLASALAAVRERADEKRISLTDSVPAGLPALAADSTSVEQVLVNLLDNAVKYTPEGGRVCIRAQQDGRMVRIDVEDTGIGIPAEHLPRIFERFYRVDPARTRDMGGTGLGLAIVKHLLQSHGGDVSVRSRVGGGTTFTVTLPVMQ